VTRIREMDAADWPAVEKIFAAGIAGGEATFEIETPTWDAFDSGKLRTPRLVALDDFDAVLRLLLDEAAPFISGRLLSARWDDLAILRATPPTASLFQLRRIDGVLFESAAKDS